jgi:DNA invertase Pin-like site-specific DNA recombinase
MLMLDDVHIIELLAKPHLDLTTPGGRWFIAFLSAMAEHERLRIIKRARRQKGVLAESSERKVDGAAAIISHRTAVSCVH